MSIWADPLRILSVSARDSGTPSPYRDAGAATKCILGSGKVSLPVSQKWQLLPASTQDMTMATSTSIQCFRFIIGCTQNAWNAIYGGNPFQWSCYLSSYMHYMHMHVVKCYRYIYIPCVLGTYISLWEYTGKLLKWNMLSVKKITAIIFIHQYAVFDL